MSFVCPICFFDGLPYPPIHYEICPCCGTEFENDDEFVSHADLRAQWVRAGMGWTFEQPPVGWNPRAQLARMGLEGSDSLAEFLIGPSSYTDQAAFNGSNVWPAYGNSISEVNAEYSPANQLLQPA